MTENLASGTSVWRVDSDSDRADRSVLKARPGAQGLRRAVQPEGGANGGHMSASFVGEGRKLGPQVSMGSHVVGPCCVEWNPLFACEK